MFELTDDIVRQVIFGMENQNHRYVLDVEEGRVLRADSIDPSLDPASFGTDVLDPAARYHELPPWTSADGFNLMQAFLAELPNPQLRQELNDILRSGKRVFRRFKDRLSEYPDAQRRYHVFKFLEMRGVVAEWYNTLRELRGLDTLELGFEDEIGDLILTDVVIEKPDPVPATMLEELDRQAFYESLGALPADLARFLYRRRAARLPGFNDARSTVLTVYNPIGDLCGFLWAVQDLLESGKRLTTIEQLYVLPDYRRLGMAEALLDRFSENHGDDKAGYVLVRIYGSSDFRIDSLARRGFRTVSAEYGTD